MRPFWIYDGHPLAGALLAYGLYRLFHGSLLALFIAMTLMAFAGVLLVVGGVAVLLTGGPS